MTSGEEERAEALPVRATGGSAVALDYLGCKLNQAEMELLGRQLMEAGYRLSSLEEADVYILNTCTVTHLADRKCRQRLRLARRRNPGARVVAVGCYAEGSPSEVDKLGVDLVIGNRQKPDLLGRLEEAGFLTRPSQAPAVTGHLDRTRAMVKIQEGCSHRCAYCIVPLVRPAEKSVPARDVVALVEQRVAEGYKEVVLTGTRVGSYNDGGVSLRELLEEILSATEVPRLRLSSLQPAEISPGLIELWKDQRLCPHFHLALQSGSEATLARMRRRYSLSEYRQAVELIRATVPEAAITTDVIVGFPGETADEFRESLDFCRRMQFARIHVFPYSLRRGTEAAGMTPVDNGAREQRSRRMLALAEDSARGFRQRFLGRTVPVLWEQQAGGLWSGLTGNYIKVYARSEQALANRLLPARLVELRGDGVLGHIEGED